MRKLLASTLVLTGILAASTLSAQQRVCITGVVQPASGPSICQQVFTHRLDCTQVILRSSSVNLNQYVGQNVKLIGENVGVTCPLIDVKQVVAPPATLIQCGSPNVGCRVKLEVCPVGIGQWWLFGGFGTDFVPLGCSNSPLGGIDGTWLLGGPLVVLVGAGQGVQCGEVMIPIPLDLTLVGLQIFFQGMRRDIGPVGPLQMTNLECFRIGPPGPPCAFPNC